MNLAASLSLTAAAVELVLGMLALGFARAPGYGSLRWFAAIALTASAFSVLNLCFVLPVPETSIAWAARANALIATLHCTSWLVYAALQEDERPSRAERGFIFVLPVLGALSLVPELVAKSDIREQTVQWLGWTYRVPDTGPLAPLVFVACWMSLCFPFARYFRAARRGRTGALAQVVCFCFYYATALDEVLVGLDLVDMPYLGDFGFLAIVLSTSGDMMRRVVRDATLLTGWNRELEGEVERRMNELAKARGALQDAERHAALGRLAAAVGHEINNPLTYVTANVEHAHEKLAKTGDHALVDALGEALDGTARIRRIVEDLRIFSRSRVEEKLGPTDLAEALEAAVRLATHDLRHRARVSVTCEPGLPLVLGDAARLGQVFTNLLVNAGQALDVNEADNRIDVSARGDGQSVVVEIRDTGEGIDPEHLPRIFEPYFTTRAEHGGTGLGLSISREIVHFLGGTLEVTSELGRGTTVRVMLHASSDAVPVAERSISPDQARPRRRVLVVDDDILVGRSVRRLLNGHEVDVVNGGDEALERLAGPSRYDVILCDVMMPNKSGMELWEAARARGLGDAGRFVFMTGGAVTDAARAFLERDGVRWIPKPLERGALLDQIERIASASTASAPGCAGGGVVDGANGR